MKKVVAHNQSIFDVVIQHFGSMDSLFEFTQNNNLSTTDDLTYGSEVEVGNPTINEVINTYIEKKMTPATDLERGVELLPEGIGYWTIGIDFKAS
jgi:hypothetical protein